MGTFVSGPIAAVLTDPTGHQIGSSTPLPVNPAESGAVNYTTAQVALNAATATLLKASNTTRRALLVTNNDAAIVVYVGVAAVTSATGHKLAAGASITIPTTAAVYAISASATPSVSVTEVYD